MGERLVAACGGHVVTACGLSSPYSGLWRRRAAALAAVDGAARWREAAAHPRPPPGRGGALAAACALAQAWAASPLARRLGGALGAAAMLRLLGA